MASCLLRRSPWPPRWRRCARPGRSAPWPAAPRRRPTSLGAAAAAALAAAFTFGVVEPARADVAGLTPCAKSGLLCGTDGLPHLIADPGLALRYGHGAEVF